MDAELRSLQRAADADPADEVAARNLDAALRRAGDHEGVRERFRVKYECPLLWDDLTPTRDPDVRHCSKCNEQVHAAPDEISLRQHVHAGHCVAFPAALREVAFVGFESETTLHTAKEPDRPCVVFGAIPPAPPLPEEVLDIIPSGLVHRHRAVPLAIREGRLVVAVSPMRVRRLDQIKRAVEGREIAASIVSDHELARLYQAYCTQRPARQVTLGRIAPQRRDPS